jgi:hypothetical protein
MAISFKAVYPQFSYENRMSSTQEISVLVEVVKALNLGTVIPSVLTLALMWKLYGFFNELSEKLTRIELKIDSLDKFLPYKIKECVEQMEKPKPIPQHPKHNPSIKWVDVAEIIGVGFGFLDFIVFFALLFQASFINNVLTWMLFLIPAICGVIPIFVSKKKIAIEIRAAISLISVVPWVLLVIAQL